MKLCKYYESDSDYCKKLDRDINSENFKDCNGKYYKGSIIKKYNNFKNSFDASDSDETIINNIPFRVECINCKSIIDFDESEFKKGSFICPDCGTVKLLNKSNINLA